MEDTAGELWVVREPATWPRGPEQMSISTLNDLEACPRRWALSAADYPRIWTQAGYPRPIQQAALEGTVVHLSLQRITSALASRGCLTMRDDRAIGVLRELGGYTEIIQQCLQYAVGRYEGNPRAERCLELIRARTASRTPELRRRVQRFLLRLSDVPQTARGRSGDGGARGPRRELPEGVHAEVELRAPTLGWRGFADLLSVSATRCEIRDFKTGLPKEEHALQVCTYALLWARDSELNPSQRLADRLVLSYEDTDVEVPAPSGDELEVLEAELRNRTTEALAKLTMVPPQARPSQEVCGFCNVRQLCGDYWRWDHGASGGARPDQFADLQVRLVRRHGPTSWDVVVELPKHLVSADPALLRMATIRSEFRAGQRLRVLNVRMAATEASFDEAPVTVASMGESSETFVLASEGG